MTGGGSVIDCGVRAGEGGGERIRDERQFRSDHAEKSPEDGLLSDDDDLGFRAPQQ